MLQIIGWLMCVYLLVKAFELMGNGQKAQGGASALYFIGGGLSLIAAPIFLILINAQANSGNSSASISNAFDSSTRSAYEAAADNLVAAADATETYAEEAASLEAQADALEAEGNRTVDLAAAADAALEAAGNSLSNAGNALDDAE